MIGGEQAAKAHHKIIGPDQILAFGAVDPAQGGSDPVGQTPVAAGQAGNQRAHLRSECTDQTGRKRQRNQHQHRAIDDPVQAAGRSTQPAARQFRQGHHQHRAEQRTGHRSQSADQREHRDLDGGAEREHRRRLQKGQIHRMERPDQRGQHRRHHHRFQLDVRIVDARRQSRILALAHRCQIEAEPRLPDRQRHAEAEQQQREGDIEVIGLV